MHAHGPHVVHLLERAFALHLLPDAVDVLGPPGDFGVDAFGLQAFLQLEADALEVLFPIGPLLVDELRDLFVFFRIQVAEAQVFQFPLHLPDAQPIGQRREEFQRFLRDALAALFGQHAQRAHVVQPIGQFDQDHARIVHHRQEHLAQRFEFALVVRSGGLRIQVIELAQLGHAFDQTQHFLPEFLLHLFAGVGGVFQRIVQQAGRDGWRIQAEARSGCWRRPGSAARTARPRCASGLRAPVRPPDKACSTRS